VTKTQTMLTSLVAAVPAGVLSAVLVMVFLSYSDALKPMAYVVLGSALACSGLMTLMPFGILVFGGRKARPAAPAKAVRTDDDVEDADEPEMETGDDIDTSEVLEDTDDLEPTVGFDTDEVLEETEELEDLFEDDDEPPAKKPKKKR
jgi:hypothetical protein